MRVISTRRKLAFEAEVRMNSTRNSHGKINSIRLVGNGFEIHLNADEIHRIANMAKEEKDRA